MKIKNPLNCYRCTSFNGKRTTSVGYDIHLCNTPLWSSHISDGWGWIRIFDYGISWKDINKHELTFGQRNKISKYIMILKYCITFLNKNNYECW